VRDEKLKQAHSNLRRGTDAHHSMGASSQDGCGARLGSTAQAGCRLTRSVFSARGQHMSMH